MTETPVKEITHSYRTQQAEDTASHNDRTMYDFQYEDFSANKYYVYDEDKNVLRPLKEGETFRDKEIETYEEKCRGYVDKANDTAKKKGRQKDVINDMEDYYLKHMPYECVIQLGGKENGQLEDKDLNIQIINEMAIKTCNIMKNNGITLMNYAEHSVEETPHIHIRFQYFEESGKVNQNGTLKENGVPFPSVKRKEELLKLQEKGYFNFTPVPEDEWKEVNKPNNKKAKPKARDMMLDKGRNTFGNLTEEQLEEMEWEVEDPFLRRCFRNLKSPNNKEKSKAEMDLAFIIQAPEYTRIENTRQYFLTEQIREAQRDILRKYNKEFEEKGLDIVLQTETADENSYKKKHKSTKQYQHDQEMKRVKESNKFIQEQKVKPLRKELDSLDEEITNIKGEIKAHDEIKILKEKELEDSKNELTQNTENLENIRNEKENLDKENENLRETSNKNEEELKTLKLDNRNLKDKIFEQNKHIEENSNVNKSLKEELKRVKKQVPGLDVENTKELLTSIRGVMNEFETKKEEAETAEEALKNTMKEVSELLEEAEIKQDKDLDYLKYFKYTADKITLKGGETMGDFIDRYVKAGKYPKPANMKDKSLEDLEKIKKSYERQQRRMSQNINMGYGDDNGFSL